MGAGHAHALYVHEHSPIHSLPPQVKVASAVSFVLIVAITPREAVWSFAAYALAVATVAGVSRIRPSFILVRLIGILPFVAFAFLIPFIASGETIGILGLDLSREGLWSSWNIIAKAGLGATTSILLAGTTEVPDILAGLGRLRVPAMLTAIAGFMIRYLELIVEEIGRMRVAMTARGYDPRWLWQARPIAASAGTMFVRSYERGERVHDAMLARGFQGEMPELRRRDPTLGEWMTAAALPVLGLAILIGSWVIG